MAGHLESMLETKICAKCETLLKEAHIAIRVHERDQARILEFNVSGRMAEADREYLARALAESFNSAQSAWDNYREHLVLHGFLKPTSQYIHTALTK